MTGAGRLLFLLGCLFGQFAALCAQNPNNPYIVEKVLVLRYLGAEREGDHLVRLGFISDKAWDDLEVPELRWDNPATEASDLYFVYTFLSHPPCRRTVVFCLGTFAPKSKGDLPLERENTDIKIPKGKQWSFVLKIDTNSVKELLDKLDFNNTSFDRIQVWPQPRNAKFSIILLREDQDRLLRDVMTAGGRTISQPQISGDAGRVVQ